MRQRNAQEQEAPTKLPAQPPASRHMPTDSKQNPGWVALFVKLAVLMAGGFLFGFFFERSHVYEPASIRQQFFFTKFIMIKMFTGAIVGACVSFFLVFHYGGTPNTSSFDRVGSSSVTFLDHRNGTPSLFDQIRKPKYGIFKRSHAARATIGGGMLGVGMVVAGACPGMVLPLPFTPFLLHFFLCPRPLFLLTSPLTIPPSLLPFRCFPK